MSHTIMDWTKDVDLKALSEKTQSEESEFGISIDVIKSTLESFIGVNCRFTKVESIENALIIDDYTYHLVEIRDLLTAEHQKIVGKS